MLLIELLFIDKLWLLQWLVIFPLLFFNKGLKVQLFKFWILFIELLYVFCAYISDGSFEYFLLGWVWLCVLYGPIKLYFFLSNVFLLYDMLVLLSLKEW